MNEQEEYKGVQWVKLILYILAFPTVFLLLGWLLFDGGVWSVMSFMGNFGN